jgi:hypothetical protein
MGVLSASNHCYQNRSALGDGVINSIMPDKGPSEAAVPRIQPSFPRNKTPYHYLSPSQLLHPLCQPLQRTLHPRIPAYPAPAHLGMLYEPTQRLRPRPALRTRVHPGRPLTVLGRFEVMVQLGEGGKVEPGAKVAAVAVVPGYVTVRLRGR